MVVPFGVGQFTYDKRRRGVAFAVGEVATASLATFAYIRMVELAEEGDVNTELRFRMVSAVSTATFAGIYTAQVIDGARLWQLDMEGHEELAWYRPTTPYLPSDPAVDRFLAVPSE